MSAIGPGDWVECVDASPCRHTGRPLPLVAGSLYRVREVAAPGESLRPGHRSKAGDLTLEGVRNPYRNGDWPFRAVRFRPVYRPRADLIETLLQPVDGVKPRVDA